MGKLSHQCSSRVQKKQNVCSQSNNQPKTQWYGQFMEALRSGYLILFMKSTGGTKCLQAVKRSAQSTQVRSVRKKSTQVISAFGSGDSVLFMKSPEE
jgi:hypothetical protein